MTLVRRLRDYSSHAIGLMSNDVRVWAIMCILLGAGGLSASMKPADSGLGSGFWLCMAITVLVLVINFAANRIPRSINLNSGTENESAAKLLVFRCWLPILRLACISVVFLTPIGAQSFWPMISIMQMSTGMLALSHPYFVRYRYRIDGKRLVLEKSLWPDGTWTQARAHELVGARIWLSCDHRLLQVLAADTDRVLVEIRLDDMDNERGLIHALVTAVNCPAEYQRVARPAPRHG